MHFTYNLIKLFENDLYISAAYYLHLHVSVRINSSYVKKTALTFVSVFKHLKKSIDSWKDLHKPLHLQYMLWEIIDEKACRLFDTLGILFFCGTFESGLLTILRSVLVGMELLFLQCGNAAFHLTCKSEIQYIWKSNCTWSQTANFIEMQHSGNSGYTVNVKSKCTQFTFNAWWFFFCQVLKLLPTF